MQYEKSSTSIVLCFAKVQACMMPTLDAGVVEKIHSRVDDVYLNAVWLLLDNRPDCKPKILQGAIIIIIIT